MKPKIIIHCADIHIRNVQRQEEYGEVLEAFINKCAEIASNYEREEVRIVICGDLVHSKTTISNELFITASAFLRELEKIADVIVISGNHDLLMNNKSRTDTLTALFETAEFEHCTFIDSVLDYESGIVCDNDVMWALYSIHDDYKRPDIEGAREENPNSLVIGLYHAPIVGSILDNGTTSESGSDMSIFEGCDIVMAGDIHKRQVLKYKGVKIVYPGSLIQQTFGETVSSHGFVVWNLEDGSHEFVDVESQYGMYNIEIEDIKDLDEDKEKITNP